jgi:hypothetical protein
MSHALLPIRLFIRTSLFLKVKMCVIHTRYRRVVDRYMSKVRTVAH